MNFNLHQPESEHVIAYLMGKFNKLPIQPGHDWLYFVGP